MVSVSCSAIDWKIVRSSWYPSLRVPRTRSERLIFAKARTRIAEFIEGDGLCRLWHVDAKYFGPERLVQRHLRQCEAQVEPRAVGADEVHRPRQPGFEL